jgi:hypothetical protein
VVKPRTLDELIELERVMLELGYPGKCGCETRTYVQGLYGGYFYNRGLEEGIARCEEVRNRVDPEIPVYLKRGCTEFEINHGPSDKWEVTDAQREIEGEIDKQIYISPIPAPQTPEDVARVYGLWRTLAWKFDDTFDGGDVFSPCVTYG